MEWADDPWCSNVITGRIDKFDCRIIRNYRDKSAGSWLSGYVKIPYKILVRLPDVSELEVAGGVTFADYLLGHNRAFDEGYWLGFVTDYSVGEFGENKVKLECAKLISSIRSKLLPRPAKWYAVKGLECHTWVNDETDELYWRHTPIYVSVHHTKEEAEKACERYKTNKHEVDRRTDCLFPGHYRTSIVPYAHAFSVVRFRPDRKHKR